MDHSTKKRFRNLWSRFRFRKSSRYCSTPSEEFCSMSSRSSPHTPDEHQLDFHPYTASMENHASYCSVPRTEQDSLYETYTEQMASPKRHSRPYTISSDDWVIPTPSSSSPSPQSQVLSLDDLSESQLSVHFHAVLQLFAKIYALAKLLQVLFMSYGVEVDTGETGLMHWIQRAESEIRTDSLAVLIEVVENLFYALYSRMNIEMAAVELCCLCKGPKRHLTTHEQFYLPDPNLLYRIFLAIKDFLDSPTVCAVVKHDLVAKYQEGYVHRVTSKEADRSFRSEDGLGYRRYALSIASDQSSDFYKKWKSLIAIFNEISAETFTTFAENYFTQVPKVDIQEDIPYVDLPFIDLKAVDLGLWERQIIQDHRLAALAKLEGKNVGDERHEDPKYRLSSIVKHRKCICTSVCFCARGCTNDVERPCPCAERQLRIQLAKCRKGPGLHTFAVRTSTLAYACFRGLASVRPDLDDDQLMQEIENTFAIFELEIQHERSAGPIFSWS